MHKQKIFKPRNIPCLAPGCSRFFFNTSGRTQHMNRDHVPFDTRLLDEDVPMDSPPGSRASSVLGGGDAAADATPPPPRLASRPPRLHTKHHQTLNGRPCDRDGNFLPPNTPAPPRERPPPDDFTPYAQRADFDLADLLYRQVQMSAGAIDELMQNWAARPGAPDPPFADHEDLYNTIDTTEIGHVPWESFTVRYNRPIEPGDTTPWRTQEYIIHFRDPRQVLQQQLANPDFKSEMDFAPKQVFVDGQRQYEDFMSGNWAWKQAEIIVKDPATHGSTFVPVILGSDKTTVSVATGQNKYYPLYMSNGLVHNGVRHAHRNAVTLIGFLAIPKTDRENQDSIKFRTSIALCLSYIEMCRCTAARDDLDGPSGRRTQFHTQTLFDTLDHGTMWDQYGVIPDVLPFTWDFPRADIYELLSPDLLHQVIKGTFKDHLVTWVGEYLEAEHGKAEAKKIMADIDRRIAAVPPFPGLRRFLEGRGFKQWTGDSKALMKVYLPAIEGYVPPQMLWAFSTFLDFCYLVRRNVINETTLLDIDASLARYHQERVIFTESGVCPNGFCLPRQHSLTHYHYLVQEFGAPNGLCSSITESKHIKAVKEPWRRSSRYEALIQMLTINDRLDKLAAARVDFVDRGMMAGASAHQDDDDNGGAIDDRDILGEVTLAKTPVRGYPRDPITLAQCLNLPQLVPLVRQFLFAQDNPDHDPDIYIPLDNYPDAPRSIKVFPSAVAKFFAPSDQSGIGGMLHERIRAVRSWRGGAPRYDCIFPCPDVGMWMVEPDVDNRGQRVMDIIHIDTILRAAHLIGIYGHHSVPRHFKYSDSLDSFKAFYINKYADHHAHEIAF
ncbi:hypothetical protein B0H10DRAFT_2159558 [Mycena sp. CBHHK59/15]|nr:hypothetical protein B0H10DRAFT_2159558 [Mycena sp. CBHHK59/15]